jgi:geranylgeranyl diphosphate synthase type II
VLGLGPALRILDLIKRMARESVEGQMLELDWIRRRRWDVADREYVRMVHKKTGWYSFISPIEAGAIAAGAGPATKAALGRFALCLGIAFQIQDDLLSLQGSEAQIGKDPLGDLWEGKYTLPLLHTLRAVTEREQREALAILARPRGQQTPEREREIRRLYELVVGREGQSLGHARAVASRFARRGRAILDGTLRTIPDSVHRQFLRALVDFVLHRSS